VRSNHGGQFYHATPSPGGGGLHIKLSGHFDGTSACALKHCLQDALNRELRVIVHTDKLASLSTFGREMFQKQFSVRPQITARIVYTGAYTQAKASPRWMPSAVIQKTRHQGACMRAAWEVNPWKNDRQLAFMIRDR